VPGDSEPPTPTHEESTGVLAALPRTRPQRSTRRRIAARGNGSAAPALSAADAPQAPSVDDRAPGRAHDAGKARTAPPAGKAHKAPVPEKTRRASEGGKTRKAPEAGARAGKARKPKSSAAKSSAAKSSAAKSSAKAGSAAPATAKTAKTRASVPSAGTSGTARSGTARSSAARSSAARSSAARSSAARSGAARSGAPGPGPVRAERETTRRVKSAPAAAAGPSAGAAKGRAGGRRVAPQRRAEQTQPRAVPRQGFASDGERVSGPVQPPGGAELIATAAEIVSELAKAGVSTGERLIKDVVSRLPLG